MLELKRRHQKFDDTPYALEPNLKESPGGLRDLQVFLWCARAAGLADSVEAISLPSAKCTPSGSATNS